MKMNENETPSMIVNKAQLTESDSKTIILSKKSAVQNNF